jgi:hypothetical protein
MEDEGLVSILAAIVGYAVGQNRGLGVTGGPGGKKRLSSR